MRHVRRLLNVREINVFHQFSSRKYIIKLETNVISFISSNFSPFLIHFKFNEIWFLWHHNFITWKRWIWWKFYCVYKSVVSSWQFAYKKVKIGILPTKIQWKIFSFLFIFIIDGKYKVETNIAIGFSHKFSEFSFPTTKKIYKNHQSFFFL